MIFSMFARYEIQHRHVYRISWQFGWNVRVALIYTRERGKCCGRNMHPSRIVSWSMEEKERRRKKKKGKRRNRGENERYSNTQVAPIEKFDSRSAVDTRLRNSRNPRKSHPRSSLGLLETPPDEIKALRERRKSSRAKYEAARVYLCDRVVITRARSRLSCGFPK